MKNLNKNFFFRKQANPAGFFKAYFNTKIALYKFGLFVIIAFVVFCTDGFSQIPLFKGNPNDARLEKANDFFKLQDYDEALNIYSDIVSKNENDTFVICKIGECYKLLNETKNAESWFRKVISGSESNVLPEYILSYAQVLTSNKKYDEALLWFNEYTKYDPADMRAWESIKSLENISELSYDTTLFLVQQLPINTESSELCPAYFNNGIFFLSDRNSKLTNFLEWFYAPFDADGNLLPPQKYNTSFKTEFNEGPVTFYDNYNKMIFTQNYLGGQKKKNAKNVPLKLFSASRDSGKLWKDVKILPFDMSDSYSQPSVSGDGKCLYFASDAPGGFGGSDLYVSYYKDSAWTQPVNMGSEINTADDEVFPFIFNDTILYFSSNGHGGLGLLDIFKINIKGNGQLQNLGMPINSPQDDFGLIMDNTTNSGYFTSNRKNGVYDDDIYSFKRIKTRKKVRIVDEVTQQPVSGAKLFATGNTENPVAITDSLGNCYLVLPLDSAPTVKVEKEYYDDKEIALQTVNQETATPQVVTMLAGIVKEGEIILTDENYNFIFNPEKVIYKVQILASKYPANKNELSQKYSGPLEINDFFEDNWYKYSIGNFSNYKDAIQCVHNSNVSDAFVIAYMENKKVNIVMAKLATKEENIPPPISIVDAMYTE